LIVIKVPPAIGPFEGEKLSKIGTAQVSPGDPDVHSSKGRHFWIVGFSGALHHWQILPWSAELLEHVSQSESNYFILISNLIFEIGIPK